MPGDAHLASSVLNARNGLRVVVAVVLLTAGLSIYVDVQDREVRDRDLKTRIALEETLRATQARSDMLLIAVLEQNVLRLNRFEPVNAELELALTSVAGTNRNPAFSDEITALLGRHRELLTNERQAMTLMQEGRWHEARQALVNEDFVRRSGMFEIDLRTTVDALNSTLAAQAELFDMLRTVDLILRIATLALLLWVGARYSRQLHAEVETQRRIQAELNASRQALRDLAAHDQALRDEERKHMAQEIHDELGQRLTVLRMDLAMLPRAVQDDPGAKLPPQVTKMKGDVDAIVAIVRDLAGRLRPAAMEIGLAAAVESLLREFEQTLGIPCDLEDRLSEHLRLSESCSSAAFRIVQESLTNIARHAGATRVKVRLEEGHGHLRLRVEDNGQGFLASGGGTFGLTGIRERAESLGGSVHIASQPGAGTTVEASIPLDAGPPQAGAWLARPFHASAE